MSEDVTQAGRANFAFVRVFLSVFLLIFLGSGAITFILPETYQSVARAMIPGPEAVSLFHSDEVLLAAAETLDLKRRLAEQHGEKAPLDTDRTLKLLRRQLRVRPGGNTVLVEIHGLSRNPREAAELANAVAKAGVDRARQDPQATRGDHSPAIVDLALPSTRPIRPNKVLNLVLGALVGTLLGIFSGGVAARLALGFDRAAYESRTRPPAT